MQLTQVPGPLQLMTSLQAQHNGSFNTVGKQQHAPLGISISDAISSIQISDRESRCRSRWIGNPEMGTPTLKLMMVISIESVTRKVNVDMAYQGCSLRLDARAISLLLVVQYHRSACNTIEVHARLSEVDHVSSWRHHGDIKPLCKRPHSRPGCAH